MTEHTDEDDGVECWFCDGSGTKKHAECLLCGGSGDLSDKG